MLFSPCTVQRLNQVEPRRGFGLHELSGCGATARNLQCLFCRKRAIDLGIRAAIKIVRNVWAGELHSFRQLQSIRSVSELPLRKLAGGEQTTELPKPGSIQDKVDVLGNPY